MSPSTIRLRNRGRAPPSQPAAPDPPSRAWCRRRPYPDGIAVRARAKGSAARGCGRGIEGRKNHGKRAIGTPGRSCRWITPWLAPEQAPIAATQTLRHRERLTASGNTPFLDWVTLVPAGLLACSSAPLTRPSRFPSGFDRVGLAAYSCGGSRGITPRSLGRYREGILPAEAHLLSMSNSKGRK